LCLNSFQNCSKDSLAESDDYLNTCQHLNHFESFDLMPTTPRFSSWILDHLGSFSRQVLRTSGLISTDVVQIHLWRIRLGRCRRCASSTGRVLGAALRALRRVSVRTFLAQRATAWVQHVQSLLMLLSSKSQVSQVFRIPKFPKSLRFPLGMNWDELQQYDEPVN